MDLLKQGWELGSMHSFGENWCWMQKRLGHGGKSKNINRNTVRSLEKRGLIVRLPRREKDTFSMSRYGLKKQETTS